MYQLIIVKDGISRKVGGEIGPLQDALRQLEGLKVVFGPAHASILEDFTGIKIDDFYVFVLDGTGNYIKAVKYKKEEE